MRNKKGVEAFKPRPRKDRTPLVMSMVAVVLFAGVGVLAVVKYQEYQVSQGEVPQMSSIADILAAFDQGWKIKQTGEGHAGGSASFLWFKKSETVYYIWIKVWRGATDEKVFNLLRNEVTDKLREAIKKQGMEL